MRFPYWLFPTLRLAHDLRLHNYKIEDDRIGRLRGKNIWRNTVEVKISEREFARYTKDGRFKRGKFVYYFNESPDEKLLKIARKYTDLIETYSYEEYEKFQGRV